MKLKVSFHSHTCPADMYECMQMARGKSNFLRQLACYAITLEAYPRQLRKESLKRPSADKGDAKVQVRIQEESNLCKAIRKWSQELNITQAKTLELLALIGWNVANTEQGEAPPPPRRQAEETLEPITAPDGSEKENQQHNDDEEAKANLDVITDEMKRAGDKLMEQFGW